MFTLKNKSLQGPVLVNEEKDNTYIYTGEPVYGFDVHNSVFLVSSVFMLLLVITSIMFPEEANSALVSIRSWIISDLDWLFMASANYFVFFCFLLIILPTGKIRLGGNSAKPEYSTFSWLCMLFASGIGIGLMFWGVSEPVAYYTNWYGTPLNVEPNTPAAAHLALSSATYHWGIHGWAIFAMIGLSLAYFCYNKGLPFTVRSTLYPLLGERCWGSWGSFIDVISSIATVFGLATSLGLGAQQVSSGLHHLLGIDNNIVTQLSVIAIISAIAMFSIFRGMHGGVRLLSNINIIMALSLLIAILVLGPTELLLQDSAMTLLGYVEYIIPLSNWIGRSDTTWMQGWTVFYWAWWMSWAPFVGLFIAKISKGRTVREFLSATLFIPSILIGIWMAVMGGTAIDQINHGVGGLASGLSDVSLALYQMYEGLSFSNVLSAISIVLLIIFFVTSADSGSIVMDTITAGGNINTPTKQKLFWAIIIGLIAGALLYGGGANALSALQAATVSAGLPFMIILLIMSWGLYRELSSDTKKNNVTVNYNIK
ncbi:BCCT family transporter [Vibrio sp. EA2]|uniref:BCCT family transporter n=1 Tax=Vibrio sp. EA2 TaxID=3079860 RepID=UPI00294A8CF0|nr:BCCT family transporter [Vibrio sp. EA2]MDV6254002.1 BCCT family transporter [Vibrio sp. EA2]